MVLITVRDAVTKAFEFLKMVKETNPPEDISVEEVELSEDNKFWLITISFFPPGSIIDAIIQNKKPTRIYKIMKINATTGEVMSMKMREI